MIASTPPPSAAGKQWRMEALETVEAVGVLDGSNVWPVKHFGSSAHDCLHPPTCCRCVLRLSREEKTHSSRPNIYREEKGEHFWSKKLIPQILLQHIWSIWLVSGHYKKIWDSSFWNQPNRRSTFFCERDMVALEEFDHPGPLNEFAWNILGLESKCGDKYLTEPASFKSRRSSRRRNYARIRGDIPSPVQVIVNAMQCGFHTE